ncbi:hypothetical protein PHLCEN_2v12217 [Hermanssonia centrifuga]|uniref:Thioredoxin domain-containing protein n=1 Tax=Hermanssonia centrifuga TaxID=98765 RepID=A0A2R6NHR5_9APHY|nr:hypothetical protein PHLCEN_2v12217 [Hermanssonia centrifuga]
MAPEFSKAALGLYPIVPLYAVDCDNQKNKQLCAEQGVQGFPTVKLFPRGKTVKPLIFDGAERSATAFFYWGSRNIPHGVKKLYQFGDIPGWIQENTDKPRALLLNNGKHIPLLWQAIGNKYKDHIKFAIHRDRQGRSSVAMGFEAGEKGSAKVLIYPAGSTDYVRYEGIQKFDSLSKFLDTVVDGTADLRISNAEAAKEEFVPDDTELEIERKQEAQRMALAHGGFSDMIDFEAAILAGHGSDFHDKNGYTGVMGGGLPKKDAKSEDPILKTEQETQEQSAESPKMAKTGDGQQEVFEAPTDAGHPRTPAASATPAPSSEAGTFIPHAEGAQGTARAKDEL